MKIETSYHFPKSVDMINSESTTS